MKKWEFTLEKISTNKLNEAINNQILRRIANVAERNSTYGFRAKVDKLPEPVQVEIDGQTQYKYEVILKIGKKQIRSEEATNRQVEQITTQIERKAASDGWKLVKDEIPEIDSNKIERPEFIVPELTPEVIAKVFDGVFEREAHIRLMHDSVKNYIFSSNKHKANPNAEICRSHILLHGKPAGCKTTLFEKFMKLYNADGVQRIQFIDGQTMSKAGLENWVLEKAEQGDLPEILAIEEIEKQPPDNLVPLISIMGSGYLAKLNARIGLRREVTPVVIWATCNNKKIIKEYREGVLWSRFTHKLHCSRPSRELMKEILLRRIRSIDGDEKWADEILKFAYETLAKETGHKVDDPREILGFIDGRERLMDGSYQADILKVWKTETDEEKKDAEDKK